MAIATTAETQVAFAEEVTWGITPVNPSFQRLRLTGEGLTFQVDTATSDEIRPDAMVSDLIRTRSSAGGDIRMELSAGAGDTNRLLALALRGSFVAGTLKAGVAVHSLTIEKRFQTGSSHRYLRFPGCRVERFSLVLRAGEVVTARFDLRGKGHSLDSAPLAGAAYLEPNGDPVLAAPDVATISLGGLSGAVFVTDLSLQLRNNLRIQTALGQLTAAGVGYGRREITGSMTVYFESLELYEQFVSGATSSLTFEIGEGGANGTGGYAWHLPRLKYRSGQVLAGGNDQDVLAVLAFQALFDPTEATDLLVHEL